MTLSNAYALVYVEQENIFLYFPENETNIASRLSENLPKINVFLKKMGIPCPRPLHIILDPDLDFPGVEIHMIPHREIRIPLKAPGVLEDGYLEKDPWTYFLFKGLCLQGLRDIRSGLPKLGHHILGNIVSPNAVIPQWTEDGTCMLLYDLFMERRHSDPYHDAIIQSTTPPNMDRLSNHPDVWPGFYSYRIFGRPFIRYVYHTYGWEALRYFFQRHGGSIIPIEIDSKAGKAFNKTWPALWNDFKQTAPVKENSKRHTIIKGYWPDPFIFWNVSGIYPGIKKKRHRSRYGFKDQNNMLWVSEYDGDGISQITGHRKGISIPGSPEHVWDPGIGDVAVTRIGHRPCLILLKREKKDHLAFTGDHDIIPGPAGAVQMSGPVRNGSMIAVSAHVEGNWDIWVHNGTWHRVTDAPAIDMDPFWDDDRLVYASSLTGTFQIYTTHRIRLTETPYGATLPRYGNCIAITGNGSCIVSYPLKKSLSLDLSEYPEPLEDIGTLDVDRTAGLKNSRPYTPLKSLWPNYIRPDGYADESDIQVGVFTKSRDVSRDFKTNAGIRYSMELEYLSLSAGAAIKDISFQGTRYPVSYSTHSGTYVYESRHELKLTWEPFGLEWLAFSLNKRYFEDLGGSWAGEQDTWAGCHIAEDYGDFHVWGTYEAYTDGMSSLFGGFFFLFGSEIYSSIQVQGGKTWQTYFPGHGSFRVGGNMGEGYFTRRPSRLFPLRGFDTNLLEAGSAVTSKFEIYWPLFNIQKGYQTLPLFFHRLRLGTFLDAGACSDDVSSEDILVGSGIELITSMEVAWGTFSRFRIGVAWPVHQPDGLDESGPELIIQIGRPL